MGTVVFCNLDERVAGNKVNLVVWVSSGHSGVHTNLNYTHKSFQLHTPAVFVVKETATNICYSGG
jgi:hypothetical protein